MRTSTSTGLGGASVISSIESGLERAHGRGAPMVRSTAALHRIVIGFCTLVDCGGPEKGSHYVDPPASSPRPRPAPATSARLWRLAIGPKGMSPAQVAFWEDTLRKATQSAEWKADMEQNFWSDNFTPGAAFSKSLAQ